MKKTWEIINEEKGKTKMDKVIHSIRIDKELIMIQNNITNVFNKYFLSIEDSGTSNNIYT
jgi:hypothetical protein